MHEVVHLSLGPQANHINSCFYNCQETYFVFTDEEVANSLVDPSVRFVAGKEYTPRAGFWDFRGGFGNRLRFNAAYEQQQTAEQLADQVDRLQVLDQAKVHHANLYWAASLRVPLHPKQQFELPDWEFDPVDFVYGKPRGASKADSANSFLTFDQGADQFAVVDAACHHEYLDNTIRRVFEQCDNLSGVNLTTDLTGWGGFAAALLEPLRDDYAQKVPVFSWAASSRWPLKTESRTIIDSHLESLLGLCEFSDLVVPLRTDPSLSFAENAGNVNLLFETTGVLSSLRRNRVSMATIADDLTIGSNANIVLGTTSAIDLVPTGLRGKKVESKVGLLRSSSLAPLSKVDEMILWDEHFREQLLMENGTFAHRLHKHVVPQALPCDLTSRVSAGHLYAELSLNDGVKNLEQLVGINHDLKTRVLDLVENYKWGYETDSESE